MVTTGKVVEDCNVRVLRKGKEVFVGTLDSLRRVKETVKEVCKIFMDPSTVPNAVHFIPTPNPRPISFLNAKKD